MGNGFNNKTDIIFYIEPSGDLFRYLSPDLANIIEKRG
jgi:hypothetical protein